MMYCEKCKVSVTDELSQCPLCRDDLIETKDEKRIVFPNIPFIYHRYNLFFRILLFVSVSLAVVAVAVDMLMPGDIWWSILVVGAILCLWLCLWLAIKKRNNLPKGMLYQVVLLSSICVIWELLAGWRGWSINFVIPALCTAVMIALPILATILEWEIRDLMLYMIIDEIFAVLPLLLLIFGVVTVRFPSVICVVVSIISTCALIIFRGEEIAAELKRRFHF